MIHSDYVTSTSVISTAILSPDVGDSWWTHDCKAMGPSDSPLTLLLSRLSQAMNCDSVQVTRAFTSAFFASPLITGLTPSEVEIVETFAKAWSSALRIANRGGCSTRSVFTCFNRNTGAELVWVHEFVRVFNKVID